MALASNAACESVERGFPDTPVGPDDEITVGLTQGGVPWYVVKVTEHLPEGFEYVDGSYTGGDNGKYPPIYHPSNNTLVMCLAGSDEITVTYNVTTGNASQITGWFFGTFEGLEADGVVTGDSTLTSDTTPPAINSVILNQTVVTAGDPILVMVDATDDTGVLRVWFRPLQLTTSSYKIPIAFFDRTFIVPYAQGHCGYIKVVNDIPARTIGVNIPVCWPQCEWDLETSFKNKNNKICEDD